MRIPNPKAVTTTEAYLAYKAEVLEQSELKDKLYHPYLHIDGWLAYWTGLIATYPTDKNGDPECLTDEEAYIAYLAGVTSEYPEALKDPADVRVASYLRYLISARFGRPDYPVTREEFYLSMMKPRFIPSGDPSSEIELDGTVEAPFVDVKMYGDTFQQTYSGTNLLPASGLTPETYTGGLTITPVYNTNDELMYILANGTYTGEEYFYYHIGSMSFIGGETYTCSGSIGGSGSTYRIWVSASNAFPLGNRLSSVNGAGTATASANQTNGSVDIQIYPNATLDNVKFYPQIELNSEATTYEPYVGGTSAPNPDYPQDIDVVTGRQEVGVRGKNLLTGDYPSGTNRGIAYSWDNVFATLSGTATSTYSDIVESINMPLREGTYTFSINKPVQFRVNLRILYGGSSHDARIPAGDTSATITIPSGTTDAILVRPYIDNITSGTVISETFGLMLQDGSDATAFEPYQSQSYEINLGKNIIDFSTINYTGVNGGTGTRAGGTYTVDGGSDNWGGISFAQDNLQLEPNTTYTFSATVQSTTNPNGSTVYVNRYMNTTGAYILGNYAHAGERSVVTFTTPDSFSSNADLRLLPRVANTTAVFTDIQLEKGSTATPYAPYFEPIELCKLGDYQDYIYRDADGDWYVHKETNKTTYDGSETWTYAAQLQRLSVDKPADVMSGNVWQLWKSNYLHPGNTADSSLDNVFNGGSVSFFFKATSVGTSLSDWKTWLSANNLDVYYSIATPTDTQITNSELISQLDALVEGGSYNGKTYIKVTATDPNLPGLLYVEAAI